MNAPIFDPTKINDPLLKGMNERQYEAVTMSDDDTIILAGAGSGKTRVLTSRIAWLMREGRADSKEILAVTFTNKAAKEMRTRLQQLVSVPTGRMWIGTFHGLCHRMLRENAKLAGLPSSFSIMDQDDQLAMVKRLLKDTKEAPEDLKPKQLQDFINKMKEMGVRPSRAQSNSFFEDFAVPFYATYEAKCAREGTIDFAELMLRITELFRSNPAFVERYQNRFSHILVDEFQDTNMMQYEWLKTLRGDRACIFAVGDDDQSIYGFRGSNPQNMTDFVDEIADGKIIRLEQNYRSTGNILGAANALIDHNAGRMGKNLWTSAGDGSKMQVLQFGSDLDEAEQVATHIKNLLNKGEDPSQIAILYRSNYQSRAYEESLMARGVPYLIYGGTRFYERMEIKNAIGYLKLTTNLNDDTAFRRVINFPPRGIGETTIDQIADIANRESIPMLEAAAMHYTGKAREKIDNFMGLLSTLFEQAQEQTLPDFIDYVVKTTGLMEQYGKKEEDKDRVSNLKEMLTAAKRFCEESEVENAAELPAINLLNEFLATASLESSADNGKDDENPAGTYNPRAVTLMTVHAAKGLEFDNVVIGGAEEGVFPSNHSIDEGNDEEERRLMYVAITRARKNLVATSAKVRMIYGERTELEPSRFLGEIPDDLKDTREFAVKAQRRDTRGAGGGPKSRPQEESPFKSGQGFGGQARKGFGRGPR